MANHSCLGVVRHFRHSSTHLVPTRPLSALSGRQRNGDWGCLDVECAAAHTANGLCAQARVPTMRS